MAEFEFSVFTEYCCPDMLFATIPGRDIFVFKGGKFVTTSSLADCSISTPISKNKRCSYLLE